MRFIYRNAQAASPWICVLLSMSLVGCPDATITPGELGGTDGTPNDPLAGTDSEPGGQSVPISGTEGGIDIPEDGLGFGEACTSRAVCESRICFSTDSVTGEGVCTIECDAQTNPCPDEGWACQSTTSFGDVCVPVEPKSPCAACEEDWECGGGNDYCVTLPDFPEAKFCTEECATQADCEDGFTCQTVGGEALQCVPNDGPDSCEERPDADQDGIADDVDNCVDLANPQQEDADSDGYGDVCDLCPEDESTDQADTDGDGYGDICDLCPELSDDQTDSDGDGYGDACDNCPQLSNDQTDDNQDGIGDECAVPEGIVFTFGGTAGVAGTSTSANHTLIGGAFGQRPMIMNSATHQMRPFPLNND